MQFYVIAVALQHRQTVYILQSTHHQQSPVHTFSALCQYMNWDVIQNFHNAAKS